MPAPKVLGKGCAHRLHIEEEEKEVRDQCCASCIVKFPCMCCWISVAVSLIMTVLGGMMMISANKDNPAGPLKGPADGLTYPFTIPIAMQMDALKLANDESTQAYDTYLASGRRLKAAPSPIESMVDEVLDTNAILSRLLASMGGEGALEEIFRKSSQAPHDPPAPFAPTASAAPKPAAARAGRSLQPGGVSQQTEYLTSAMFIYKGIGSAGSVFTDEALAEMCALHGTLIQDTTVSGVYVGYQDFCLKRTNLTYSMACHIGSTPLGFFYGDASYDIESVDLDTFNTPNLAAITELIMNDDAATAMATYPTEAPVVATLLAQLKSYVSVHWFNSPLHWGAPCDPSMKKNTQAVINVLAAIRSNEQFNDLFGGLLNSYLDKDFSADNPKSKYTRGMYMYGAPLAHGFPPYTSAYDRRDEQTNSFVQWFWTDAKLQDAYNENDSSLWSHVQPTALIPDLLTQMLIELLVKDGLMALAPIILVFLIVWFQTRSIFIALVTVVECILSFTGAISILIVLGIRWMAFEHFLGIYIVLAIGADDVFVFMDTYKQSFYAGPHVNASLTKRMSWVYRRAGLAMLITSLTTASAFVATSLSSPIPTLQAFGIFAAAVIIFDYVLVMTLLCSAVVIYHNLFERKPGLCCACCTCGPAGSALDWWACGASKHKGCNGLCSTPPKSSTEIAQGGGAETTQGAKPLYIRIFEDKFPFDAVVKKPATRVISILVFLAIFAPAVYGVTRLEPQTSAEQFLPESHPFQRFFTAQNAFMASDDDTTVEMQIVYGFDPQDPMNLDGVNRLQNPDYWGAPKYSASFTFDEAAQQALLADCAILGSSSVVKSLYLAAQQTTVKLSFCWPEAFKAYRDCKGQSWPVPTSQATTALYDWVTNYDSTCPMASWPDSHSYADERQGSWWDATADLGWKLEGNTLSLAWTRVRAFSKIKENAYLPAPDLRVLYDEWETLIDSMNSGAPSSLGRSMHIASKDTTSRGNKWLHMILQETYIRMALTGVGIGLTIAFVVLLLATMNFIVAFLSILTIVCALCCVVASIVLRGWQLGQAESLSMMILTGFAVDYVVHLSHAYMESKKSSRLERAHDALRDLGISVFWGMLTSVISAGVLSTLQLQFFSKFGTFFLLTIVWAYLWSVLFLMPLLAIIGPSGTGPGATTDSETTAKEMQVAEKTAMA